jgi:FHS family L-fucose permease-like MFS transporter
MFPTIYGIALEGLNEKESKICSAGLIMVLVGGSFYAQNFGNYYRIGWYWCSRYKTVWSIRS